MYCVVNAFLVTGMYRKALKLLRKSTRITTWGHRHTKYKLNKEIFWQTRSKSKSVSLNKCLKKKLKFNFFKKIDVILINMPRIIVLVEQMKNARCLSIKFFILKLLTLKFTFIKTWNQKSNKHWQCLKTCEVWMETLMGRKSLNVKTFCLKIEFANWKLNILWFLSLIYINLQSY
jgi:hypothetical protein